jgi:aspartyl-tRNA(Asn)/glutamyl-tRNA(Gln) amidotransferase subunit A
MTDGIASSTTLHDLPATALLDGYRAKRFSPSEVLDDVLAHVAAWEPHLKALYAFEPDQARDAAKAATERWSKGAPQGALDGVPCTIKENVATKGVPVPLGSIVTKLVPAAADAPPSARLREAGAVIFSKTTMPDMGMLSSGLSSFHALTRNPWDLSMNPGGSSAGAGAAGAAGYGPLHLGTDIGGSVRLPANWCGLVALKPSLGRIPIDPPYVGRVAGPMTRTVDDAALMMRELSKPDPRDGMGLPPQDIDWFAKRDVAGLRIGVLIDQSFGIPVDPQVRHVAMSAAGTLADAGALVREIASPFTGEMVAGLDAFWRARAWSDIVQMDDTDKARVLPFIYRWAEGGAHLTGVDVVRGFGATMTIRAAAAALFEGLDYIVSPVAPIVKFPAENASPMNDPADPFGHIGYTVPWNMAENPALSINGGYDQAGFPIGVQIIGRRFDDGGVMAMARAFEQLRGPQRPWPIPPR